MNRKIGFAAAIVMCCTVAIFLICLIVALFAPNTVTENLSYGVCTVLSWGYVAAGCVYSCYARKDRLAASKIGVSMGVVYSTIISIVYFTQMTTVLHKSADEKILQALPFTVLLMVPGACFVCMFVPVLPLPATNQGSGGTIALIGWCLFFLPICILSAIHFKKNNETDSSN